MGNAYAVDLGFDWNAQGANSDGSAYLQWGIVNTSPQNVLSTLNNLNGGDTIIFNIFDLTQYVNPNANASGGTPSLNDNWMTWSVADGSGTSPFTQTTATFGFSVGQQTTGASTVFSGSSNLPGWSVLQPGGVFTELFTATVASVTAPVSFSLTWQLDVTVTTPAGQTTKTFKADPDMIVRP
ncbi:MAG TPA: hypothetical protein VFP80_11670 [Thermoanaerobaculia bacterium]|nr:hypothetical protein [Thermoanaerobaculia bacterium]